MEDAEGGGVSGRDGLAVVAAAMTGARRGRGAQQEAEAWGAVPRVCEAEGRQEAAAGWRRRPLLLRGAPGVPAHAHIVTFRWPPRHESCQK